MPRKITLTHLDLLQQVKYRYQLPDLVTAARQHQVLLSAAEKEGIVISAEELQQSADRLRIEHQLLSAKDTLSWLERYHFSIDDFENLAYITLIRSRLSEQLFADRVVTHFADRQLDYMRSTIYEIILPEHELAMELFYALQEQEMDFLAALHQYSPQPQARSVRRRDLLPELSGLVFAATPPTLLSPIRTPKASHLIYVAAIVPAELTDEMRSQIQAELFDQWLVSQSELLEVTLPEDLVA
jgi:parvulin-like peptidyl-prolyl isomerase